jgi:uncharacterized protein (TIGR03083 family)
MTDAPILAGLRAEVIDRALDRRPAGRPVDAVEPCTPLDAFALAVDQLHAVLLTLHQRDWDAPAHHEIGTVRDVVAHLVGVERLMLAWVEADAEEPATATEHVAAARAAATADLDGIDPRDIAVLWHEAARRALAACAVADPSKAVLAHDLPTDVDGLLVLRAFELWAHLQDVCRAAGRPCPPVDEPRLALMSGRLMDAVPVALFLRGIDPPARIVRFVLTGAAARCYDVAVGGAASPTADGGIDVTIVADTVDVCRVAARRATHDGIDVIVEGDEDVGRVILGALDAFARD